MKTSNAELAPKHDLNSPAAVEEFRKAAIKYTATITKSRDAARQALIGMGIYTKSGRISKNYR